MRVGLLRNRVQIQAKSEAKDAGGGLVTTWTTIATVWGSKDDVNGRELATAGKVGGERVTVITIRYYAGLTNKHRLLIVGMAYNITFVADADRKTWTKLTCTQGLNNG